MLVFDACCNLELLHQPLPVGCVQIEAADKQLKATRQFLEEQAAEREQERDEFVKEIERLKSQMRDKDKDKVIFERVTKEVSDWFSAFALHCTAVSGGKIPA